MSNQPPDPFASPSGEPTAPSHTDPVLDSGVSQQPIHTTGPQANQQYYTGGQQEHPQGTLILILGILGFFVGLSGPVAWIMGNKVLKEMDASPGLYSNRGNVVAGRVCGIIVTVFMVIFIVLMIAGVIMMMSAGLGSTETSGKTY